MKPLNILQFALIGGLKIYQRLFSPVLMALFGPASRCRFDPSCSEYALQAIRSHGSFAGSWLALKRLLRCHPWGGCGHDQVPVPKQRPNQHSGVPITASHPHPGRLPDSKLSPLAH